MAKEKVLSENDVDARLDSMKGWVNEIDALSKNYTFHNFKEAMSFAQKVGEIAENAQHHPDIFIHSYKNVQIILTTHDAGGITEKDFAIASEIDTL